MPYLLDRKVKMNHMFACLWIENFTTVSPQK